MVAVFLTLFLYTDLTGAFPVIVPKFSLVTAVPSSRSNKQPLRLCVELWHALHERTFDLPRSTADLSLYTDKQMRCRRKEII